MNERTLKLLEFDKIFNLLENECISYEGRELLRNQKFFTGTKDLIPFQIVVGEIKKYMESDLEFPELRYPPISELPLRSAKTGAVLEGEELYSIAEYCISASRLKKYFITSDIPDTPHILDLAGKLKDISLLSDRITSVLDPSGKVKDNHPELKKMRSDLRNLHKKISKLTSLYMGENKEIWQADVPTERDGRVVLPLKANFRGRVQGIIHNISARGATVFIEPFDILELNNKIAVQENEIIIIIRKILGELTAFVGEHYSDLSELISQIAYIDTLIARARFSFRYKCIRAESGGEDIFLNGARHLLLGNNAVPIDIRIDEDLCILIISGPNAGGKTVTLKTVGLLVLMNQFGMDIPALEGSRLKVFDSVFADIGDDQSLEKSLSTFSAHMQNISSILEEASCNSLVLLDELGSGTDPAEGVSIAMAVLDSFIEKDAVVFTTSHHGLLKNYGYTRRHVSNASMEFDTFSHTPTYRVIFGMPGESHAIEIAKTSGLPAGVIEKAENYMRSEQSDISAMIKELENKQREIFKREKLLREEIKKHDLEVLKLRQYETILKNDGYAALNKFLKESRRNLENLVKELREGELTKEKTKRVKKFISHVEEHLIQEEKSLNSVSEKSLPLNDQNMKPGMSVKVGEHKRPGTLLRKEKNGDWIVTVGAVKMSFPASEIYLSENEKHDTPAYSVSHVLSENHAVYSLDIRGFRTEEAEVKVTKQLDNAIMSGMREFVIIHGKGEGALSRIVNDILKESPAVLDYSFARPEDGGFGKTIVRLKG